VTQISIYRKGSQGKCGTVCRPLPSVVAPVLKWKLGQILGELSASFPPAAACLRATAADARAGSGPAAAELMEDSDDDLEGRFLTLL